MNKRFFALLLAAAALALTGCSLAQIPAEPESTASNPDRFMGIYLVGTDGYDRITEDENWVDAGTETLESDIGPISLPRKILPGRYDPDSHDFTFPGVEGFALFAAVIGEGTDAYSTMDCDLADAVFQTTATDFGTDYDLSGTLYYGEKIENWIWTAYNVYQAADGTVYLDGSGNSYSGGMSFTVSQSQTQTVDGEEAGAQSCRVEIAMKKVDPLTGLRVRQYGGDGQLLGTQELPVSEAFSEVDWDADAQWAVVEEIFTGGVVRSAYDRPTEGDQTVTHMVILLDESGIGVPATVTIQG